MVMLVRRINASFHTVRSI